VGLVSSTVDGRRCVGEPAATHARGGERAPSASRLNGHGWAVKRLKANSASAAPTERRNEGEPRATVRSGGPSIHPRRTTEQGAGLTTSPAVSGSAQRRKGSLSPALFLSLAHVRPESRPRGSRPVESRRRQPPNRGGPVNLPGMRCAVSGPRDPSDGAATVFCLLEAPRLVVRWMCQGAALSAFRRGTHWRCASIPNRMVTSGRTRRGRNARHVYHVERRRVAARAPTQVCASFFLFHPQAALSSTVCSLTEPRSAVLRSSGGIRPTTWPSRRDRVVAIRGLPGDVTAGQRPSVVTTVPLRGQSLGGTWCGRRPPHAVSCEWKHDVDPGSKCHRGGGAAVNSCCLARSPPWLQGFTATCDGRRCGQRERASALATKKRTNGQIIHTFVGDISSCEGGSHLRTA